MDIDKKILAIYDEISKSQKSILRSIGMNEAAALAPPLDNMSVTSGFGPRSGRQHTGVDLSANGANVKSPADGVVEIAATLNDDCGGTIKINHPDGIQTGYCHMKKINVKPGNTVRQGDVIGISGGGANDPGKGRSDGPHLHFTCRKNGTLVDPMSCIGKEGVLSPLSSNSNNSASEDAYKYATDDQIDSTISSEKPVYARVAGNVSSAQGLREQRDFGKNISNRYGKVIIPKDDNPKIKSPLSGKIVSKYSPACNNQITIENNDNGTIYLQYCGISSPKNLRDGQSVSVGDVLGNTDKDVEVNMFDHKWSRIPISSTDFSSGKKETEKDDTKKTPTQPEYFDPFMAALLGAPAKIFQDKFDKQGNRVEKRYGGVADKKQVDPFILNFLKDPFNRKKVNENIQKIKKML
jgi:biotin carboxyl carrier protein